MANASSPRKVPDSHNAPAADEVVLQMCDLIGSMMEFWGFRKVLGRIWTLLYLSPEPLSAADIKTQLGMSVGGVSMGLKELERWGVVKRAHGHGSRREFFEAETELWKMISRVLREREQRNIEDAVEHMNHIQRLLKARERSPATSRLARFQRQRIEALLQGGKIAIKLIDGLLATARFDATPLRNLKLVRDFAMRRK